MDKFGAKTKIVEDLNMVEEHYQELLKKSLALGRIACKVSQPNEAVGVLMPNITNTLALIFGMSAFKRIPAMLNYTSGTAGIQNACVARQCGYHHYFTQVYRNRQTRRGHRQTRTYQTRLFRRLAQ